MKTSALGRIALATGITALTAGFFPATAHADDAVVERRTLPVLVEFTDSSFQYPDKVKESTPDTYFGTKKDSLASFYSELSRGRYRVVPAVDEQYLGPIKLSMAASCNHGEINSQTQKALAEQGLVRGEDYDSLSMVFPAQKTGCDWAGLGSVPGPYTWINLYGTASGLGVVGHEFGHNLGLGHQTRSMCTDGDLVDCEANGTSAKSMMGGGGPAAGLSAPEMIRAGWLSDSETVKVAKSGTYTLRSLHGEGSGTRALDIPMGKDRLVVEYRHEAGSVDQDIEGVHAYRVPEGNYGSSTLIDTTEANKTAGNDAPADADAITSVTDRTSKVSVAVASSGDGRAEVKVSLNGEGLSTAADTPKETAAPAPAHTGTDTDAGDGLPDGTEAQGDIKKQAAAAEDSEDLAATGGDSSTLPLAAGGAALVVVGAGALVLVRRRKRA
ncbi:MULTISPECIES: LAETG motif-containing sortase-dependent surface protein [Streptomyces]|uniref:LAETG motif-containing sortase-dependent surface protein n=1 Tax=Streptomyces lienomycini TaxID=284035 RepID=A0ABV9X494_9ACTN|nr:LAETG motif-containing sortase-dependent surface protein [Streptomyces sp. NBC_00334]